MIRDMNPSERRAYDLGVRAAIDAARIVAISIETADDANTFRKQVAAGALAAFAEAAEGLKLTRVKAPAQSTEPYDVYERVATIPAAEAFRPLADGKCAALRK